MGKLRNLNQEELTQLVYQQQDKIEHLKRQDRVVRKKIINRLQSFKDGKRDWDTINSQQKLTLLKNAVFALLANEVE